MLYLNKIVRHVAPTRKTLPQLAEELVLSAQGVTVYQKVYGLQEVAVANDETLDEFLAKVLEQVVASAEDRSRIKYIFHCHAAPSVSPSGSALVNQLKKRYGLGHAVSFGMAQDQCATPITAFSLAEALLEHESDDSQVLLLTGELNFHPRLRVIPNTTIIGDAAAACLVGKRGDRNEVLSVAQRKFELADTQPAAGNIPVPTTSYGDDLIAVAKEALELAGVGQEDIAVVVIHNVNTISWKFFARNFPFPLEKIFMDNVAKTGHCFTSDPFINYCDVVESGRLSVGDYFLMVSVGTSSTFAAAVIRH